MESAVTACAGSRPSQGTLEGPSPGPRSSGSPGKRRVGATELLKKFIKMSSSTETQRVRNATEEGRGGEKGNGTRQSRRKQQRSESAVHTHTRQLQRGTDNERKMGKSNPKTSREGPGAG